MRERKATGVSSIDKESKFGEAGFVGPGAFKPGRMKMRGDPLELRIPGEPKMNKNWLPDGTPRGRDVLGREMDGQGMMRG